MAQYEVGHHKRLAEIESRLEGVPGLHIAGNGYTGIGIPDCIRRSRQIAEEISTRPGS
jgi:oxygen-dependent protoporphyrinogen oxidase